MNQKMNNDIINNNNLKIRGRFIARRTKDPKLTMIFGYAKDINLNITTDSDVVFAAELEGSCIEQITEYTWRMSPEDILEDGIPPITKRD